MAAGMAAPLEYKDPAKGGLPAGKFEIDMANTGLVVTDPQIDFLSQKGVAWRVVGESVTEHKVVDHLEQLFKAAKAVKMPVFISPHYYFPHDQKWKFEGRGPSITQNGDSPSTLKARISTMMLD